MRIKYNFIEPFVHLAPSILSTQACLSLCTRAIGGSVTVAPAAPPPAAANLRSPSLLPRRLTREVPGRSLGSAKAEEGNF